MKEITSHLEKAAKIKSDTRFGVYFDVAGTSARFITRKGIVYLAVIGTYFGNEDEKPWMRIFDNGGWKKIESDEIIKVESSNTILDELKKKAARADVRARRFELKVKNRGTLSTEELDKLDVLENEASEAFREYLDEYRKSIAEKS